MRVEPIYTYRRPKYPRIDEVTKPVHAYLFRRKNTAFIAAIVALSGALAGCGSVNNIGDDMVETGGPAMPELSMLTEQEIVQILKYEAEEMGVSFENRNDLVVKFLNVEITLDLFNEEGQVGAAAAKGDEEWNLYDVLIEDNRWDIFSDINSSGLATKGLLEDGQPIDLYLVANSQDTDEDDLRQNFREFIEWLQSEGVI